MAGSLDDILHRYWPSGAVSAEVVGLSADEAAAHLSGGLPTVIESVDSTGQVPVSFR